MCYTINKTSLDFQADAYDMMMCMIQDIKYCIQITDGDAQCI